MSTDTTLKAQAAESATPLEPFIAPGVTPGTFTGIGAIDPQYSPGSDQYELRRNPQFKAVNSRVFELFDNTEKPPVPGVAGAPGYSLTTDENRAFVSGIRGLLPEGKNSTEDAAWYAVNVMRPQAVHDAKHIFGFLRPIIEQKMQEAQKAGGSFYPGDLTEADVIGLAKQAGINPFLVNKLVAEQGEVAARKATRTYTMGNLMPMLDAIDSETRWGEAVYNDPARFLFDLKGQARRDAFLAMARWKEKHSASFLGGIAEGLGTVIMEGGYAIGGVAEGSIGTIVSAGTLGNVLMENGRTVLSDSWLQKPREEQEEANRVLQTAHELARRYGPEIAKAMATTHENGEPDYGKVAAVLERRFGEFADPNELEAFRRLSELKEAGAFRPQMSWERLANFGEGVLNAVPSMVKMFNSSIDPNSFFFRAESNIKFNSSMMGTGVGMAPFEAWVKGSKTYKDMSQEDLDQNIDLWTENYKQLRGDGESVSGFFYRKTAELAEAMGADTAAGVYRAGEKAAKGIMQEERLIQAGALADPVMTVMGALKLIGVGAKAAAAAKQLETVSAGLREVATEASALRASANTTSEAFNSAVSNLRAKLEAALPGATFTDDDIIGLAIGDRKSRFGQSPAAQVIRKEIGATISKNKSLSQKVKELTKQLDELPDDVAGIDKLRARPVGGAVIAGAGATTRGAGNAATALANFLDEEYHTLQGNSKRRLLARAARFVLSEGGVSGGSARLGIFAGATYLASGDLLGAAIVGAGGVGVGQLLRPEMLRQFGVAAQQAGRIQRVIAQNTSAGRRYGESAFLRGAVDLEKEAAELQAKVVRLPGKPLTAAEQAILDKANMLVDDATKLRSMHRSGLEDFLRNTGRVVWEDGVVAGTTGGVLAALNDNDAFGAGVGMGMGFSGVLRAANRATQLIPKMSEPVYARSVLGDVATMLTEVKDPEQRGHILEFLAKAGNDEKAQIQRAGIIRDLYMSTRGRVKFVKSGQFEAATILTASPEAEARIIMSEAQALHPSDPAKAEAYAKQRKAELQAAREASHRVTSLNDDSVTNKGRIDQLKQSLQAMDNQIAEQQKIVDAERIDWKDTKTVDANRIKLDRMLQARSELEANLKVANDQQLVIDGDLSEAKGKAKVEAPMRPYEARALPDGSSVRGTGSNAFYIVDGPQGKNVYVNIDTVDNIGAISEGWHALLSDSAVESMMPDMVNMMWGNAARKTPMAVLPFVTQAILDAYMADMTPEQAAKYRNELEAGKKRYTDSDGADISGLVDPTREAMTWILSAMDLDKRAGYRPGLSTRPGAMASAPSWDAVKKTLFGERTLGDNVEKGLRNLLDPTWGVFARKHSENILNQLHQSGMRFIESGDGTLRGYFFNSNNEIVRSPVLDAFYDKVVSVTGGKGSLRARPVNLYDPLIPLDQRLEFVKRNGLDWVLNEKGDGILPPLEAAQKADGFVRAIEDTLNGVPEGERGMEVYTDDAGRPVRTGIPSPAEIAAISADPRIPQSYKDNLLTILRTIGSGESKAVLTAEYSNVFSMNVDAITEHRLRIGKDIPGKTETRNIIPLAFTMGEAPIYDAKGKKVRVPGPDGKMMDATQRVIRVHGFDINAFTNSKNHAFQQGLYIVGEDGARTYLKDPKGNQYTAAYINQLFGTEAEFMNKATMWMRKYYANGPLDPYSPTPKQPNGSPREVNPVSAEVLDPVNPERGAAMRDALRAIFGLESGKKRLGWVEENRTTNTANGMLTRGTNFPLSDFRLDQFGPLKENGQSMFIDQIGVTSGQFVMSIKGWGSTKIPLVAGKAGATMRTIVEAGDGKYLPGNELSVTEVRTHPTLPDVKLFIGTTQIGSGKPLKTIAYTLGDGRIIETSTSNEATAIRELRKALSAREDAVYIDSILNEYRYNRDKPLEGTQAPKVESKGEVRLFEPIATAQDFVKTLEGLYQVNGRDMPPSVRAVIGEYGLDAAAASKKTPEQIMDDLVAFADGRKNWKSSGDQYRHALEVLKDARDMVRSKSYGQRSAYNVPTQRLTLDSIKDTFGFGKGSPEALTPENRMAGQFFELSKEFSPDQFTNNKQYLEAVIAKLDEQLYDAASLEGDEFTAATKKIQPLKDAAERALGRLKNQMPELWAEQPAPAPAATPEAAPAATPEQPAGRDIQPRAGEAPEAPYMTPQEIAATREFRVAPDGTITRIPEKQKTEYDRWRARYEAIIKKRQQEAKAAATAAERERRIFFAEQNRRAQVEIDSEERFAADYRRRAQQAAERDAREAARLQKEADQAQARADALRLNFERGMESARAAADIKRVETNRLIEAVLSSEQPLIAPGLLLVDANRLTVQPFRMAVATDTVRTPSATARTGILYLKNMAGFEGQTQAHQQAFFNYLFAEQIGRGKAIATEAFRGPMAAQQGINLLNSRVWVAENSGARLVRLYKNADKAAGKDLVTYKVYGANGMLIKQANDAQDAVEAIQNLEVRFINTLKGPIPPVNDESMGRFLNQTAAALMTEPASARPKNNMPQRESKTLQIPGFERYLPAKK